MPPPRARTRSSCCRNRGTQTRLRLSARPADHGLPGQLRRPAAGGVRELCLQRRGSANAVHASAEAPKGRLLKPTTDNWSTLRYPSRDTERTSDDHDSSDAHSCSRSVRFVPRRTSSTCRAAATGCRSRATAPAGSAGRRQAGRSRRLGGIQIQQGEECPPGTTEVRPRSCQAPSLPTTEHRRLPSQVDARHGRCTRCRRRSSRPSISTGTRSGS